MAKPTQRSGARYDLVMNQLIEAAELLFAQQGVAGTTLQELAEAVGLTRTGIYHYVSKKDDLLEALVRGFTVDTAATLQALAADASRPAIDRLREGIEATASKVAEHPRRFRLLLTSEAAFPDELAQQHRAARRDTLTALTSLIQEAIRDGSCRPVDAELAAFTLLGAANWAAFWYPRKEGAGATPPPELARQLTDIALAGLVTDGDRDGVAGTLRRLQRDVARLQELLPD